MIPLGLTDMSDDEKEVSFDLVDKRIFPVRVLKIMAALHFRCQLGNQAACDNEPRWHTSRKRAASQDIDLAKPPWKPRWLWFGLAYVGTSWTTPSRTE